MIEKMVGNDTLANQSTTYHIHYLFLNSSAIRRMPYNLSFSILFRVEEESVHNYAKKTEANWTVLGKLEYMVALVIEKLF